MILNAGCIIIDIKRWMYYNSCGVAERQEDESEMDVSEMEVSKSCGRWVRGY